MNKLEKLASDHAYWADKVRELKAAGVEAYGKCTSASGKTCIETIFDEWKASCTGHPGEDNEFEEVWDEMVACEHCQDVRRMKAERMNARRRLGDVRAAITRVGRKLAEEV